MGLVDNDGDEKVNAFEHFLKESYDIRPLSNDGYVVLLPSYDHVSKKNNLYVVIADNNNVQGEVWYPISSWYDEIIEANDAYSDASLEAISTPIEFAISKGPLTHLKPTFAPLSTSSIEHIPSSTI